MTTTSSPRLITAEDLLELSAKGFCGELVRGELIEEMPPGVRHGKIVGLITYLLCAFVLPRELGTVVSGDTGVILERVPDTVRGPDIAFFSSLTIPLDADIPGYAEVVPEFVAEVGSPSDSMRDRETRARMWLSHGVDLVWMVHPESRQVDVYQSDMPTETLIATDQLSGHDAVPGFHCSVGDLFGLSR